MKLNIVPARTGTQWVREGVRTFFKQPLAMAGLFFMFMASLSVAAFVPLDRLLIETDSPYLAPVPYRGKTNNPSYVPFVAKQIAQVRGISIEEVAAATSANFDRLFKGVTLSANSGASA